MRLFEFEKSDPLRIKLVAVASQLKADYENSQTPITTDQLLQMFSKHGIKLDKSDLFDIVKKDPLKNIIDNINGQEVVFKGEEPLPGTTQSPDQAQATVNQMAKRAAQV
jgi:hypothetical protein